ncbi:MULTISPECIES: TetR/AcrR family transcriptional regulator [Actinomyces]|uniref:TetR/AcrR family transcriptional regulator n=1 Tax=Actinomyces respiraculi TaxID=2744574 RepID=A0A7T0LKH2_9ACTO|nr:MULTISPECIES: TetR/AcrR family transcriptional regulator [Actinomyces]QPL05277.1 TetR/AcrR family transcriptional regulator [Actinomyces respiraculi]
MTTSPVPPPDGRTRYANGGRRRAEIVEAASAVFAEQGFQNLSMRQIADAIGVSHTLLRHHFGRKEAILEAVLTRREEIDQQWRTSLLQEHSALDAISLTMARNATTPGLIQLDALMHAEAVNPEHPAHDYVVGLAQRFRAQLIADLRAEQEAGRVRADVDVEAAALCLACLIEGVQLEWLLDRSVDMAAVVGFFVDHLRA